MPKIQDILLRTAFYLYRSRDDAEHSRKSGGTGFIVGLQTKDERFTHLYAVSNWHVAMRDGCSVIRLNRNDGGKDIIETEPSDWIAHPDGYDIAVCPLEADPEIHNIGVVLDRSFATKSVVDELGIAPGEDVFMVGRFVDHEGHLADAPAARFGHISVNPSPIKQTRGKFGDSYVIDLHSRTGYSGSPVFVYRTPGNNFESDVLDTGERFMFLLGIHWGQFPELWEITEDKNKAESAGLIVEGKYVKGVSGMTAVCPAWQIMEVLKMPELKKQREMDESELDKDMSVPVAESSIDVGQERDRILKNMLNTPPTPHDEVKKKPAN